eukprot:gene19910-biopygen6385
MNVMKWSHRVMTTSKWIKSKTVWPTSKWIKSTHDQDSMTTSKWIKSKTLWPTSKWSKTVWPRQYGHGMTTSKWIKKSKTVLKVLTIWID